MDLIQREAHVLQRPQTKTPLYASGQLIAVGLKLGAEIKVSKTRLLQLKISNLYSTRNRPEDRPNQPLRPNKFLGSSTVSSTRTALSTVWRHSQNRFTAERCSNLAGSSSPSKRSSSSLSFTSNLMLMTCRAHLQRSRALSFITTSRVIVNA